MADNPFNFTDEDLLKILQSYSRWCEENEQEKEYIRVQADLRRFVKEKFLDKARLDSMDDDDLVQDIIAYSRKLEGPVRIRLGTQRVTDSLPTIKAALYQLNK